MSNKICAFLWLKILFFAVPTAWRKSCDTSCVNRAWYAAVLLLAGCGADPQPASFDPEAIHLETAEIRKAVDLYKTSPNRKTKALVDGAFAEFDRRLAELREDAAQAPEEERAAAEASVAALKRSRDLVWARCQAAPASVEVRAAQDLPVRRAQQVQTP